MSTHSRTTSDKDDNGHKSLSTSLHFLLVLFLCWPAPIYLSFTLINTKTQELKARIGFDVRSDRFRSLDRVNDPPQINGHRCWIHIYLLVVVFKYWLSHRRGGSATRMQRPCLGVWRALLPFCFWPVCYVQLRLCFITSPAAGQTLLLLRNPLIIFPRVLESGSFTCWLIE